VTEGGTISRAEDRMAELAAAHGWAHWSLGASTADQCAWSGEATATLRDSKALDVADRQHRVWAPGFARAEDAIWAAVLDLAAWAGQGE
jgi:peptidoglycan/xylan/chitin deacetylase (PgdA/CDA1 family)